MIRGPPQVGSLHYCCQFHILTACCNLHHQNGCPIFCFLIDTESVINLLPPALTYSSVTVVVRKSCGSMIPTSFLLPESHLRVYAWLKLELIWNLAARESGKFYLCLPAFAVQEDPLEGGHNWCWAPILHFHGSPTNDLPGEMLWCGYLFNCFFLDGSTLWLGAKGVHRVPPTSESWPAPRAQLSCMSLWWKLIFQGWGRYLLCSSPFSFKNPSSCEAQTILSLHFLETFYRLLFFSRLLWLFIIDFSNLFIMCLSTSTIFIIFLTSISIYMII